MTRRLGAGRAGLHSSRLRPSGWVRLAVVAGMAAAAFSISSDAFGNHITGTYGSRGYTWLARYSDMAGGQEWITSNYCTASELDGINDVRNSTAGTSEFAGKWPSGLRMNRNDCTGTVTQYIDISLDYSDFCVTHGCGTYGGENHSTLAPSSWCAVWGAPYPCGSHPSVVHLNKPKWLNTSNQGRRREFMHETGHSQGLDHHCSADSIMNDGTSGCNGGRWLQVTGYLATDRQGIVNVFPGFMYP
jgi:hypothetical protein